MQQQEGRPIFRSADDHVDSAVFCVQVAILVWNGPFGHLLVVDGRELLLDIWGSVDGGRFATQQQPHEEKEQAGDQQHAKQRVNG